MSDKKYVVPRKMWNAAHEAHCQYNGGAASDGSLTGTILQAAIRWQAENPIEPTDEQASDMWRTVGAGKADERYRIQSYLAEWQRICFLAPEQGVPDAVKDLLAKEKVNHPTITTGELGDKEWSRLSVTDDDHNRQIIEAYNRGKAGK